MRSARTLWWATGSIGLLSTLLFLFGFGYAVHDILYPTPSGAAVAAKPTAADAVGAKDKLQIVALGDSLTKGTGDETGEGYVGKVKKKLEQVTDKPVYVWNFAVDGYTTQQVLSQDFAQPNVVEFIGKADVILLTIGGNDLNRAAMKPTAPGGQPAANTGTDDAPELNYAQAEKELPGAESRLEAILTKLSELNPKARIVYVGLYEPYPESDPDKQGALLLNRWNSRATELSAKLPNLTVVPTFDLFQNDGVRFLFADHFHPNGAGYERIAQRVAQVLQ